MALADEVGFVVDGADDPTVYGTSYLRTVVFGMISSLCSVDGKPLKYSEVTDEMTDEMTAEEYTAYYEIYSTRNAVE